jgi:hypothetical protein
MFILWTNKKVKGVMERFEMYKPTWLIGIIIWLTGSVLFVLTGYYVYGIAFFTELIAFYRT